MRLLESITEAFVTAKFWVKTWWGYTSMAPR